MLPFLGNLSLRTRTQLQKIVRHNLPSCKINVIFKSVCRISNFFHFKDRVDWKLKSHIIYKFTCRGCNASYIGKTKHHYGVRASEHLGISARTGNRVALSSNATAVTYHLLECGYPAGYSDFESIGSSDKNFHLELKESLFIMRDDPSLNKNIASRPLC